ncbi:hypothetical protein DICPUDRAFT_35164 [Dictyostelium purpureum]|uniref:Uncharacterized protein n=1 Tax=Dictyostelium purpureum TaxID=5786 RepID=F0ZP02_DICPU|nr:uncharacterized protein DICPUDRAFT_35164 [Dictyostelium purpureum]EGC34353.1 hypothetical protein DICPUDRAFT_35164 [Dictyostelium purpureum]|eukprot:XP_003289146.1 hypothetical protein DICPUDRAFT_35164 [Dictyostelium purpureum]
MFENLKRKFPRSPIYYATSLTILFGSFYLMDKYLQGGYYQYIKYHNEKRVEKEKAIDDLARNRIKKRKEEKDNQPEDSQNKNN